MSGIYKCTYLTLSKQLRERELAPHARAAVAVRPARLGSAWAWAWAWAWVLGLGSWCFAEMATPNPIPAGISKEQLLLCLGVKSVSSFRSLHLAWRKRRWSIECDVVIRSATEPETNFNGLYTQEGVQNIWNQSKIFTEQEVMNFTNRRFFSPSICEYPTLEGDLSSSKERPEAKPIIGVKRSLSAFQKAQYQEKWPRNYEVMIQSPKPAKPVLHLPQLEASRFNQLQTRNWRPGDQFIHSGSLSRDPEEIYKFIPCTSNHWIRRILIYFNLPYLESQALKLQQLFFLQSMHDISTFQTIKKIPRKLTYPLKPSRYKEDTIYIHLAKILIIKPPTASFQGAINSFASKSNHVHMNTVLLTTHDHPSFPLSLETLDITHPVHTSEMIIKPFKLRDLIYDRFAMPRQNQTVENLLLLGKIRERGCSSPTSSSPSVLREDYRFKRAITTHVPTWRLMGRSQSPSLRDAAASPCGSKTLWEMNEVPSPRVLEEESVVKGSRKSRKESVRVPLPPPRSVRSGSLPAHLSDPSHSPVSESERMEGTGSRQRKGSSTAQKLRLGDCNVESKNHVSNGSFMDVS
ncbi:hypothetical protein F2Q68_00002827 [Brassica cretica]|uniref:Uncharacterized protein n=1 Tax=Brassica cretica TaxID=69181 RepID=A0A8S9JJF4_BRACR|nr:hypothetical protein F2Q68_00002827 [Brassica cretica]